MPKEDDDKLLTVEDIRSLRAEISLMHSSLAKDVVGHAPLIQKVVERFVERGLQREWVEKLLATLVGSSFEDDEEILVAYVLEELDILLKVEEESQELEKTIHIIVGGTGIGKTSLVGKLATRYTYVLKKSHKAVFLNLDQQKVGAVEQLENYADAMDIDLITLDDFLENEYDVIFVDTAGNRGDNIKEIENFIELVESCMEYRIIVSLALSATSKMKDLEALNRAFEMLAVKNYILTKLDETCDLSDMINFLITQKTPVSYISTGQEIPEDLIVASKEYLLKKFMED